MSELVLAVNVGSGTATVEGYFSDDLVPTQAEVRPVWRGEVTRYSTPQRIKISATHPPEFFDVEGDDLRAALRVLLPHLWQGRSAVVESANEIIAVGHRIVHGGPDFAGPTELTDQVRSRLREFEMFAPLHNPPGLDAVDVGHDCFPRALHVALFDTSFHHELPMASSKYAIPTEWQSDLIRRYGFHGISHQQVATSAVGLLGLAADDHQLITVHLGGGCSATAVRNGRSVATTMGFTPNSGMVMAARSGSIDPGLLTYLQRNLDLDPDALDRGLNQRSGLMGLMEGRTGDISAIHELSLGAGETAANATKAIEHYVLAAAREIATMRCSLDRLDALVFTGGAVDGEPWLVDRIGDLVSFLGYSRYGDHGVKVLQVATNEELAIARTAGDMVRSRRGPHNR